MATLATKQEEFRAHDEKYKAFLATLPEDKGERTAEQNADFVRWNAEADALAGEVKGLMAVADAERSAADREAWAGANEGAAGLRTDPASGMEVIDAPIYRGKYGMALQFRDVILSSHPDWTTKPEGQEAARQLQRMDTRRVEMETRAAGAGAVVSNPTDGGFFLESEQSMDLMDKGFGNGEITKRCDNRTMTTDKQAISGIDENSRADGSRGGGIQVFTTAELETATPSKTKFKKVSIEPNDISGFAYFSNRMLQDVPFLYGETVNLFNKEFEFKTQTKIFDGVGSNEPEGVFNCPSKIAVPKEAGQAGKTITNQNILDMEARMFAGSQRDAIYVINQDAKNQLYSLSYPIGTGGVLSGMFQPPAVGEMNGRLNGRELIVIEQAETLGTEGDIALIDFSQYILARRGSMQTDTSAHLKFDYNQLALRIIIRIDGRCRWRAALTPYKGTATTSPIVTIAVRA